jgi:hypothetical protein
MNRIPGSLHKPARVPTSLELIHWRRVLRQSGMAAFDAEPFMGRHPLICMGSLQRTLLQPEVSSVMRLRDSNFFLAF